jgi:protein-S-isoprenylcysteine O-methyltransferase Ste14
VVIDALRLVLVAGLILHKAVWEFMKRGIRQEASSRAPASRLRAVKAFKIAILAGIVAQTFAPEILPLSIAPAAVRSAGLVLYTLGLSIALAGRLQLGDNWLDIESASVKREQLVVSAGVYRFIRHPIYTGDLLLLIGLELALNSWLVLLALFLVPVVLRQAIREERMLAATLPGYDAYCRATKRFIPFFA